MKPLNKVRAYTGCSKNQIAVASLAGNVKNVETNKSHAMRHAMKLNCRSLSKDTCTVNMARLTVEEKDMVVSVSHFFEKEKDTRLLINVTKVIGRTAEACGVSESTVVRCRREQRKSTEEEEKGTEEEVRTRHGRPKISIDEFTAGCIRRVVHSFYRTREHPTLDKVLARCQEEIRDFPKFT